MALVPHRLDGDVVADLRVALRVAGDASAGERTIHLGQGVEQAECAVEPAEWRVGVAGRDEHVVHPADSQPGNDVREVRLVVHQPGRQVRHYPVAVRGKALGQVQGRPQPFDR